MLTHGEDLEQYELLLLLYNVKSTVTESQHVVGALRRRPQFRGNQGKLSKGGNIRK